MRNIGQYMITIQAGNGASSTVYMGSHKKVSHPVAVKVIEKKFVNDISIIKNEIEIMKTLRHPNIVTLYDSVETDDKMALVMTYVPNGNLFSMMPLFLLNFPNSDSAVVKCGEIRSNVHPENKVQINHNINIDSTIDAYSSNNSNNSSRIQSNYVEGNLIKNEVFKMVNYNNKEYNNMSDNKSIDKSSHFLINKYHSNKNVVAECADKKNNNEIEFDFEKHEKKIFHYFSQICDAVDYLHNELHIVHRDLKGENILIDEFNNVKLIDFGMSKKRNEVMKTRCGSPSYASPELILCHDYNEKTDVWSLGVLLYFLATGSFPFFHENIQKMFEMILYNEVDFHPMLREQLSPALKELILSMLSKEKDIRPGIRQVKNSVWFQKMNNENNASLMMLPSLFPSKLKPISLAKSPATPSSSAESTARTDISGKTELDTYGLLANETDLESIGISKPESEKWKKEDIKDYEAVLRILSAKLQNIQAHDELNKTMMRNVKVDASQHQRQHRSSGPIKISPVFNYSRITQRRGTEQFTICPSKTKIVVPNNLFHNFGEL